MVNGLRQQLQLPKYFTRFSATGKCPPNRFYVGNNFACGPSSSVVIATDCGLDGPGSNPGGDEIFRSSRPALWSNQPPVQ